MYITVWWMACILDNLWITFKKLWINKKRPLIL
jgi:hypothetical protein